MVSLYHQGIVFIAHLLACHLAAVIVEKFQGVTNGAVELTYFLQASNLLDASTLVLSRNIRSSLP